MKFSNERTDAVLNKIALLGKFNFSYNPALIDVSKPVSGNFVNKPVREVLNDIFDGKIDYKEKGGYLILQKGKEKEIKTEPKEWITFSGYVRDEKGEAIPFASVYDKASLESTVSNEYGFYRIRFYLKQVPLTLFFSKAGYVDTTVFFSAKTSAFVNVILKKPVTPKPVRPDEKDISAAAEETAGSFFKNLESGTNSVNISDTLYRKIQGSLLPYIGSNGKLGGNVINDYSFNVFGGYSLGVKKLELAGFFNLTRGDMEYVQLAGFANLNGGTVKGVQMAGFANLVKDEVRSAQFAGLANVDWNNFEGAQFAGLVNTVKGKTDGVQIAGLVNTSLDTVKGFQAAGICNVAYRSMKGTQVAGICNSTLDTLSGTQISLVNFARHINGSQLGFLNDSKSTT
ncbi:MAG TPA: STN and carboxypeptidase regulatory-like domain-containing protein, partial [Bacteroidia bacterium]|nr:STN and carboxypeptidase regulatory-like domain-containing protein [Bacteroidia bacterium]